MRRAAMIAVSVYAAGIAAFAVFAVAPWLDQKRDFPAGVPQPPGLDATAVNVLRPGGHVCVQNISANPYAAQLRFRVGTYSKPGPPMHVTIRAPGYTTSASVEAGFADNAVLSLPIRPSPRDQLVTLCIHNDGRRKVGLYAAGGRSRSGAVVTIDGRVAVPAVDIAFYERRPVSIGSRLGVTADRLATFRGAFGHPWLMWALGLLLVFGVPLLAGIAVWRAWATSPEVR